MLIHIYIVQLHFRVWTNCCSTGMCRTKHFAQTNLKYFGVPDSGSLFLTVTRDSNFICSITSLEQRHLLQKLLKQGPCHCPPQGKAHAQPCAKGCFSCLRPMNTTYARLHKTNTTPWENMRRLSLSSICVLIYHVFLGHLHTVKTNPSTFIQIFFISSSV